MNLWFMGVSGHQGRDVIFVPLERLSYLCREVQLQTF